MAKLRLGVMGAGSWTVASHLPNLARRAADVEFVAVCRRGPELLDKIRRQYGFSLEREIVWRFRSPQDDVRLPLGHDDGRYDCVGPIEALVDLALGHDVENCSPLELGARTVEILDAVYRSARSGKPETVFHDG